MATPINLLTPTFVSKSVDQNAAEAINLYLNVDGNDGKYQVVAYPTPGTGSAWATILSPVRAMFNAHGTLYAVGANKLYSIDNTGTPTILGTLNTSTGYCKIRGINGALFILDLYNGYTLTFSGNVFTQITSNVYIAYATVTASGTGYTNPTATINDSTGTGATATVNLSAGTVSSITIVNPGTGYSNSPTISISDPTGTGATATVTTGATTFPSTAADCTCQDEFGIVVENGSNQIASSGVSQLKTWPALYIASTTGNQNNNVAVETYDRQLFFFGEKTIEVWYNAGNAQFSFSRIPNVYIEVGCVSAATVAKNERGIIFLGIKDSGGIAVYTVGSSYSPNMISQDINYQINTYTTYTDAIAFTYQQEGEDFYVLTFPTQGITWVYSFLTEKWHIRQSSISGVQSRWFPSCFANCYTFPLVGDFQSGNIYKLSTSTYQENGTAITRTLVTHPFYNTGLAVSLNRLQIDFDQTPGSSLSSVNLYVSRDGGNTWGSAKPATPVQDQNGQWRCYWTRLGRARTWAFKIQTTLNGKFIILGAWAYFTAENTVQNPYGSSSSG